MHEYVLAQATEPAANPAPAAPEAEAPPAAAQPETPVATQTTDPAGNPNAGPETAPKAKPNQTSFYVMMALMFVVLYFFMIRGPRQKQKQHEQMLKAIKKNDRIQTIGGILGTVLEVRDDEVLIKIDEATNTKMRITRGAVSRVLGEEKPS